MITLYANPEVMQMATKNPRGRSRRAVTRPSQATGKSPSRRLIRRRKITARAPKGLFANPGGQGYTVRVGGTEIATFKTLMRAKQYGQALADNLGQTVSVQK